MRKLVLRFSVWLLRRYFVGRIVTREAGGMIVVGKILTVELRPTTISVLWVPLGGDLRDGIRLNITDLTLSGRDWVFAG